MTGIAIFVAATLESPDQVQRGVRRRELRRGVYGREPFGKPPVSHTHGGPEKWDG